MNDENEDGDIGNLAQLFHRLEPYRNVIGFKILIVVLMIVIVLRVKPDISPTDMNVTLLVLIIGAFLNLYYENYEAGTEQT